MRKHFRKLVLKIERIHEEIEDRIVIFFTRYNKGEDFEEFAKKLGI